jgi:DNA (cytosine-5)-methyltransferase 1
MAKGRCTDGQDEQAGYPHLICMAHGQAGAEIATNRSTTLTCLHEAPIVAQAFTVAEARRTGTIELKDQAPTLTSQTKRGDTEPCVIAFPERMSGTQRATTEDLCPALGAKNPTAVAFHATRRDGGRILGDLSPTVEAHWGTGGGNVPNVSQSMQVRRLTPRECERLQGFPDDWTNVSRNGKPAPDGPRYKAIGNSMAVPCMYWLGKRIALVEEIINGGRNGQKH